MFFHSHSFSFFHSFFLLMLNFSSYSLHILFNSSFSHQYLTSSGLNSTVFVSLLFIILFFFPYLVLSTPSTILLSFTSGLFHKLLVLYFTLSHSSPLPFFFFFFFSIFFFLEFYIQNSLLPSQIFFFTIYIFY